MYNLLRVDTYNPQIVYTKLICLPKILFRLTIGAPSGENEKWNEKVISSPQRIGTQRYDFLFEISYIKYGIFSWETGYSVVHTNTYNVMQDIHKVAPG